MAYRDQPLGERPSDSPFRFHFVQTWITRRRKQRWRVRRHLRGGILDWKTIEAELAKSQTTD